MDKKSFNSGEFQEVLPQLLKAMKTLNDKGYVGTLSKKGVDRLNDIISRLKDILDLSKGISISTTPYVMFDSIGISVAFDEIIMDEDRIKKFISLLKDYQLDPEQAPIDMPPGGLCFMLMGCYNVYVGGDQIE
jgi:hypothetical protein